MPTVNKQSIQFRLKLAEMLESCAAGRDCEKCPEERKCISIWNSISCNMTISPKAFKFYSSVLTELRKMRDAHDTH